MRSIKQNIKALLVVSIITIVASTIIIPVAIATGIFEDYDTTSAVIIHAGDSTYAKVTKFNPINVLYIVLGAFVLAFGIISLIIYAKKKDDSISVEQDCVRVVSNKRHFSIQYDEIELCTYKQNQLYIKRKSAASPLGIWFIRNSHELCKTINDRIKNNSIDSN